MLRGALLLFALVPSGRAFRLALNRSGTNANASSSEAAGSSGAKALLLAAASGGEGDFAREQVGAGFNATASRAEGTRPHSMVRGPSAGGDGGYEFDHYNHDGFAGGISEICVRSGWRVDQIEVSYAGRRATRGGWGGDYRHCFRLRRGEVITTVSVRTGGRVDRIQFTTNTGRTSPPYGREGGYLQTWTAPRGMHLMGFYGRSAAEVDKIGVWWGYGGGTAQWQAVQHCNGCGPFQYTVRVCTERRGSDSSPEAAERWASGTLTEMSSGFTFLGLAANSRDIDEEYAQRTVARTERAFSETRCVDTPFTCDKQYLWQWTYRSNFDAEGATVTHSPALVCTDEPRPCCLPGMFAPNGDPASCDVDPKAPDTC